MFNVSPNTLYVVSGTGFYKSNDPTNNVKALKEDRVPSIRLQSHQVHPTMLTIIQQLCSKKKKHKIHTDVCHGQIHLCSLLRHVVHWFVLSFSLIVLFPLFHWNLCSLLVSGNKCNRLETSLLVSGNKCNRLETLMSCAELSWFMFEHFFLEIWPTVKKWEPFRISAQSPRLWETSSCLAVTLWQEVRISYTGGDAKTLQRGRRLAAGRLPHCSEQSPHCLQRRHSFCSW